MCSHSNQLQNFDGSDYRYKPEQILNGIKTIHQVGPDQQHIWHAHRTALVATSLDGLGSSWFNSLFEADTQD